MGIDDIFIGFLISYIAGNWMSVASFDNYVLDECKESEKERVGGLSYLLGDTVAQVAGMTQWLRDGTLI